MAESGDGSVGGSLAAGDDEHLDDGFSAATPDGDSLLLDFVRLDADATRSMAAAADGRLLHDDAAGLSLTDTASPSVFGNMGHSWRLVEDPAGFAARLLDFYAGHPGGPGLIFSAGPTPDLRPHGLVPVGHPPLMFRPAGRLAVAPPDGLEVRRATSAAELAVFEQTLVEAYPVPESAGAPPGHMFAPALAEDPDWHWLVGFAGGEPVATAAAHVGPSLVDVTMVSTTGSQRGRGVGAALTAAAADAAPDRPAMLIASDDGRPVYARLGFLTLCRFTLWIVPRG